jgi:hypothetical protein
MNDSGKPCPANVKGAVFSISKMYTADCLFIALSWIPAFQTEPQFKNEGKASKEFPPGTGF